MSLDSTSDSLVSDNVTVRVPLGAEVEVVKSKEVN